MPRDRIQIGDWEVDPSTFCLAREDDRHTIEPKSMTVLLLLADHAGEVVPKEELISHVWPDTFVTDGVLWQCIGNLRRVFQDDPKHPEYIETIPRSGYRLVASVRILEPTFGASEPIGGSGLRRKRLRRSLKLFGLPVAAAIIPLLTLGLITEWWLKSGTPDRGNPGTTEHRSWVLIADFDNATGEVMLDGTLEVALEKELSAFSSVGVVDRSRVSDSLRLMRKPLNARIGMELGKEVCLRDGQIDRLITGHVSRGGDGYELAIGLWDPVRREFAGQVQKQGLAWKQILPTIHELANWINQSLSGGDHEVGTSYEAVTTPSLEALSDYTKAVQAYLTRTNKNHFVDAERLLRKAIQEDPEFASAYLLLGWSVFFQDPDAEEVGHLFEKALEYAHDTSPAERYFILGCYHHFQGGLDQPKAGWREQYEKAAVAYKAVLDLQPNHHWAVANLLAVERSALWTGVSLNDAIERIRTLARIRPNSLEAQTLTAQYMLVMCGRTAASPYVSRARQLLAEVSSPDAGGWAGMWLRVFASYERWFDGDMEGALREAARVRSWATNADLSTSLRDRHFIFLGYVYLTLGRLDTVADILRFLTGEPLASESGNNLYLFRVLCAQYSYFTGNSRMIRKEPLGVVHSFKAYRAVLPMVVLRVDPEVGRRIASNFLEDLPDGDRDLVEGDRALLEGNLSHAISNLSKGLNAVKRARPTWGPAAELLCGNFSLAEAYLLQGRTPEAVAVLESTADLKEGTFPLAGALWLEAQRLLADLYLSVGEGEKALRLDGSIRRYLRVASPGFPLRNPGELLRRIRQGRRF